MPFYAHLYEVMNRPTQIEMNEIIYITFGKHNMPSMTKKYTCNKSNVKTDAISGSVFRMHFNVFFNIVELLARK